MSPPSLIETHPNLSETAPVALSYELFPPRHRPPRRGSGRPSGRWKIPGPDYVSVACGACGSNRDTAVGLINRLLVETTLRAVGPPDVCGELAGRPRPNRWRTPRAGESGILALRGDRPKER